VLDPKNKSRMMVGVVLTATQLLIQRKNQHHVNLVLAATQFFIEKNKRDLEIYNSYGN